MGGLVLGILGGSVAAGTSVLGALATLFHNQSLVSDERSIERRLAFVLSLFLLATALSFLSPTLERIFHGGLAADYEFWSVLAAFIAGVLLVLLAREVFQEKIAEEENRQGPVLEVLSIMLKNIPAGLGVGAAVNITHPGLSYSLLCFMGSHQLFQGILAAQSFQSLGLESELTFVGSLFVGFIAVVSAVAGSVMSQQSLYLLPVLLAFAGGSLASGPMLGIIKKLKRNKRKIELNQGLLSGMMVVLILFIWKEFV